MIANLHDNLWDGIRSLKKKLIAVDGPMGVGKSALAVRLAAQFGGDLIHEHVDDNPFLQRFYNQPDNFALQTQLYFLFQRTKRLKELRQEDLLSSIRITDFTLAKDSIFAGLTLQPDELELYGYLYTQLAALIPSPDLVIYLQASVDVLMKRIRSRGILYERKLKRETLTRLTESYVQYYMTYNDSALIVINADNPLTLTKDAHFDLLVERVESISSGRHYFNPVD